MKNKNEIEMLTFRVEQLEIALSSLMWVVSHQDEELERFTEDMDRADEMATEELGELVSIMNKERSAIA